MTASEFKAWLEGYMLDRAEPDAMVIAAKAALIETMHTAQTIGQNRAPWAGTPNWSNLGIISTNAVSTNTVTDPALLAALKSAAYLPEPPDLSRFEPLVPDPGSH